MENILSPEKINYGRQIELDVARGLAIAYMVLGHAFELFTGYLFKKTLLSYIISSLGAPPAAAVFMFLMGVGIVYSKRASAPFLFKRGIMILVLAYGLGLFRDLIPSYISYLVKGDPEILKEGFHEMLGADILQFAGVTFLFFSVAIKLKLKAWQVVSCALVFSTIDIILGERTTGIFGLNVVAGLFWGAWEKAWFPFFSWIFFPVAGYVFGIFLIHCADKTGMYKRTLVTSALAFIPLFIFGYSYGIGYGAIGEDYQHFYYQHDFFGNMVLTVFVLFWISLLYFVTLSLKNCSFNTLKRWSKNVTEIYVIHWIILRILRHIIEGSLSVWVIIIMSAVILMVSDLLAILYQKLKMT